MKQIRFLFFFFILLGTFYFFNFKQGEVPALGKFMNPFMGFWQNGESESLDIPEELSSDQLSDEVIIQYDTDMVPHIFAKNDYDLYFAQGYTLAYHRLWQMEFQVLATEGRISELLGEKAIDFDRLKRRKGLVYAAKRALKAAERNPKFMNMLQAFSDGVNHRIDELSYRNYPIEYKLLDYAPEKWSPLKTLIQLKAMADMLSSGEADLENTNALALFGREQFDLLFPEAFKNIDPVIPSERKWNFKPTSLDTPNIKFPQKRLTQTIEKPDPRNGSNNFVVGPAKTASGKALLANEPDLALGLPSIWYVMQLNAPGINVMGAALPGGPGIIVGFNDSIAWGVTNAKRDVVDWYDIAFRDDRKQEYQYDDKWLKTEKVIETIRVRGGSDVIDTVIYTHYGPVVYDQSFKGNGEETNLAMKWTAHEETEELWCFYLINRAKNYDEFTEGLKYFDAPAQNFAFASATGDIALWVNGRFPIKWNEQGKFLMDGSDSRQEWVGDIPHAHKASIKNPAQGFVSSANQHPVDSTYPYYVYDYNYEFYRNRRINDRLKYLGEIRVEDMMRLQHDNYNYRASESLPVMLDNLDTAGMKGHPLVAYDLLRKWDYFNEADRLAPSIYEAWWDLLYPMIWDEFKDQEEALIRPNVFNTIHLMNNDSASQYFDIRKSSKVEVLADLINQSYQQAVDSLEKWKADNGEYEWFRYKNTSVTHLLRLKPFSVDGVKIGGNNNIVNAASATHGPSWRMVVEIGKTGVRAWGVYPGSQTGNPGNPNYGQMIGDWASGKYRALNFLHSAEEENDKLIFKQTLTKD